MPDYLPRREGDRVAWAGRLAMVLVASPEDYGLTAGEVAAFEAQYEAAAEAWHISQAPGTRTTTTVQDKDAMVEALTVKTRSLVARLRAYLALKSHSQVRGTRLSAVGLRLPSASRRALALPESLPSVWMMPTFKGTIQVRVRDTARSFARAKPRGVRSLIVLGQLYTKESGAWSALTFLRNSTQMDFELDYPSGAAAGDLFAVSVRWCSASGQMSQASTPAQMPLPPQYGVMIPNLVSRHAA